VQILFRMDPTSRQELGRIIAILQSDSDSDDLRLAEMFAPLLFRSKGSAYLSVRHRTDLPDLVLILSVMIDRHLELVPVYAGRDLDSTPLNTPIQKMRHPMHRAWSLSQVGTIPALNATAPSSPSSSHEHYLDLNSSNQGSHHVRRKTPPRFVMEAMNKRRIEFDAIVSRVVDKLFVLYDAGQNQPGLLLEESVALEKVSWDKDTSGGKKRHGKKTNPRGLHHKF